MKGKRIFYSELVYFVGIVVLAFSTALMERANLGLSMVVAPAYLVHLKLVEYLPFFSFGMAEYVFQAVLLVALTLIMGKGKIGYLLSFATAFFYGILLDGSMELVGLLPVEGIWWRLALYGVGLFTCSVGVALLFHTYFPRRHTSCSSRSFLKRRVCPLAKPRRFMIAAACCSVWFCPLCFLENWWASNGEPCSAPWLTVGSSAASAAFWKENLISVTPFPSGRKSAEYFQNR